MAGTGKRKYRCEDCGECRFVHQIERDRAAKPKCYRCGSTRLEPYSDDAKKDVVAGNLNRLEGPRASVAEVPTTGIRQRTKVT